MAPIHAIPESTPSDWPALPSSEWADTLETVHLWTQIVGKIRMTCSPWVNHSWSVPLYVTPRGLTTSSVPYGARTFDITLDFTDHEFVLRDSDGAVSGFALEPISVAQFYRQTMAALENHGIDVAIHPVPNELPNPIPFPEDETHEAYDRSHVTSFFSALRQADRVMNRFRAMFLGKVSPVHFFWGSFDHAVTRFSGRDAPEHPGGIPHLPDAVTREAYSHEVSSCGFWPGNRDAPDPIFYAYFYPAPEGYSEARVQPGAAFWLKELGEFALPYDAVQSSRSPDATLMDFLISTYQAGADLAGWGREQLEQQDGYRPIPLHGTP